MKPTVPCFLITTVVAFLVVYLGTFVAEETFWKIHQPQDQPSAPVGQTMEEAAALILPTPTPPPPPNALFDENCASDGSPKATSKAFLNSGTHKLYCSVYHQNMAKPPTWRDHLTNCFTKGPLSPASVPQTVTGVKTIFSDSSTGMEKAKAGLELVTSLSVFLPEPAGAVVGTVGALVDSVFFPAPSVNPPPPPPTLTEIQSAVKEVVKTEIDNLKNRLQTEMLHMFDVHDITQACQVGLGGVSADLEKDFNQFEKFHWLQKIQNRSLDVLDRLAAAEEVWQYMVEIPTGGYPRLCKESRIDAITLCLNEAFMTKWRLKPTNQSDPMDTFPPVPLPGGINYPLLDNFTYYRRWDRFVQQIPLSIQAILMHQMMLMAMTRSAVSAIMDNEELTAPFQKYLTQPHKINFQSPLEDFEYHVQLCNNAEPLPVLIGKLANISNALADPRVCNSASGHDPRVMNGAVNLDSCPEYSIPNPDEGFASRPGYSIPDAPDDAPPPGTGAGWGGMRFRAFSKDSHLCTSNLYLAPDWLAVGGLPQTAIADFKKGVAQNLGTWKPRLETCTIPFSNPHPADADYALGLGLAECKYECNITRMATGPRQECTWRTQRAWQNSSSLKPLESRLDCNKVNCLWSDDGVVNDKANPKCFQREACPMEAPWYFKPNDVKRACTKQGCFYSPPNYYWAEPPPTLPPPTSPPSSSDPATFLHLDQYCRVSLNPVLHNFSDQMCEANCHSYNLPGLQLCDDNCVCSLAPDGAHGGGPVPSCFLPHQDVSCRDNYMGKDDPAVCPLQKQLGSYFNFGCDNILPFWLPQYPLYSLCTAEKSKLIEYKWYLNQSGFEKECPAESFFSGLTGARVIKSPQNNFFHVFKSCAQCDHGKISHQCSKAWDNLLRFKVV